MVGYRTYPLEPSLSTTTSVRLEISISPRKWEAAGVTYMESTEDVSSSIPFFKPLFLFAFTWGTSKYSAVRQFCARAFSRIPRLRRSSDEHTSRSYRPGVTLPGAHRPSFSLSSRGCKRCRANVGNQARAERISDLSLKPSSLRDELMPPGRRRPYFS